MYATRNTTKQIIKIQALWRGYLYKKALQLAIEQDDEGDLFLLDY